jgi:hypothetical protein
MVVVYILFSYTHTQGYQTCGPSGEENVQHYDHHCTEDDMLATIQGDKLEKLIQILHILLL